ncbi:MAG: LysE family transporter [Pseudomonadota bacterium]
MTAIAHLAMFLPAAALMIALPGQATVTVGERAGLAPRKGLIAAGGMVTADLVWIGLTGPALAALRAHWPILLQVIEGFGGLALLYLGLAYYHSPPTVDQAPPPTPRRPARDEFANALLLRLSKQAPALFFAAFFPLFTGPKASASLGDF